MSYRCRGCGLTHSPAPDELCWHCAGERRLTVAQRAYLMAVAELRLTMFPHCDDKVLHARGTCRYCSSGRYARLHELRRRFGIGYTGAALEAGQEACPSEAFRPVDVIDRWPGNRAAT